jgi:hypothetical protein
VINCRKNKEREREALSGRKQEAIHSTSADIKRKISKCCKQLHKQTKNVTT